MELEGKRILVTGADGGIGSALSLQLAGRNASLVLCSKSIESLERLHGELPVPPGGMHCCIAADIGDSGERRRIADECEKLGGIDILINLAGVMDFMISEQCYQYRECDALSHYLALGKAVFNAEYIESGTDFDAACAKSRALGIATILKTRDLNRTGRACPG